jgi:hypothetical protein
MVGKEKEREKKREKEGGEVKGMGLAGPCIRRGVLKQPF